MVNDGKPVYLNEENFAVAVILRPQAKALALFEQACVQGRSTCSGGLSEADQVTSMCSAHPAEIRPQLGSLIRPAMSLRPKLTRMMFTLPLLVPTWEASPSKCPLPVAIEPCRPTAQWLLWSKTTSRSRRQSVRPARGDPPSGASDCPPCCSAGLASAQPAAPDGPRMPVTKHFAQPEATPDHVVVADWGTECPACDAGAFRPVRFKSPACAGRRGRSCRLEWGAPVACGCQG